MIATWTAEITAVKATAQATLRQLTGRHRTSEREIRTLVTAATSILDVLAHAVGRHKAAAYRRLGLRLTYEPGAETPDRRRIGQSRRQDQLLPHVEAAQVVDAVGRPYSAGWTQR